MFADSKSKAYFLHFLLLYLKHPKKTQKKRGKRKRKKNIFLEDNYDLDFQRRLLELVVGVGLLRKRFPFCRLFCFVVLGFQVGIPHCSLYMFKLL